MTPAEQLQKKIQKNGPISIADYMEIALSAPQGGYYMRQDPLGIRGDFTTAPEISQVFGELIGAWCASLWQQMGSPDFTLIEAGPGRGTLMKDLLRATKQIPGFHKAMEIALVEISPALKKIQAQNLKDTHPSIRWHDTIPLTEQRPVLLVANEFLDALPIYQYVAGDGVWYDRLVDIDPAQPSRFLPITSKSGNNLLFLPDPSDYAEGEIVEFCPQAENIVYDLGEYVAQYGGAALFIDYGYTKGHGDTLQALRQHKFHSVWENPGDADITAHVNFGALKTEAEITDARVWGPVTQGSFLQQLGVQQRLEMLLAHASPEQKEVVASGVERLVSPDQMGSLFKVMALAHPSLEPAGFAP